MVQLVFATALFALASSAFASQCFFPAGNAATSHVPCNPSAAVSTCCGDTSQCLSNGLCRVDSNPSTVHFVRGSCTDANWGSGCFSQCHSKSYTGNPVTNIASVYACNSTGWTDPAGASYCCETAKDQGTGCCSGSTFWLPPGAAVSSQHVGAGFLQESTSSSSSSSSTSSSSSSSSTSSSSTSTSTSCTSTYVASSTAMGNSTAVYTPTSNSTVVMPSPTNGTIVSTAAPVPPTGTTGAAVGLRSSLGLLMGVLAGVAVAL